MAFDAYMVDVTDAVLDSIGFAQGTGIYSGGVARAGYMLDMPFNDVVSLGFSNSGGIYSGGMARAGHFTEVAFDDIISVGFGSYHKPWTGGGVQTNEGGFYETHVTAKPVESGDDMQEIIIGLIAAFDYTVLSRRPYNVQFTDLSANTPVTWAWTFGDGGTSTSQNPLHTYTADGTYLVTLTVVWPDGTSGTASKWITVIRKRYYIIGVV